jgi:hypothetical protein
MRGRLINKGIVETQSLLSGHPSVNRRRASYKALVLSSVDGLIVEWPGMGLGETLLTAPSVGRPSGSKPQPRAIFPSSCDSSLHFGQRQVLVHLQALLAGVAADELNLRIRQSLSGQSSEHLVPEQVWVNAIRQVGCGRVLRHDLLNSAGRLFCPLPGLEEITVARVAKGSGRGICSGRSRQHDRSWLKNPPLFESSGAGRNRL